MKTAVMKATFNECDMYGNILGTNTITKIYNGINDQDVSMQITYDIKKYGYIDVKPLTKEQIEQLVEEKNESNTQI